MNNLMIFENKEIEGVRLSNQDGQVVVSSRQIAENFEKQHKHVLDSIEEIKKGVAEKSADLFIESEYQHPQNKQWYREYLMNRDGFTLLAMGFNGPKALHWKLKYIEAFNKMEQALKESQKPTSAIDLFESQVKALREVENKVEKVDKKFDELPLFPADVKNLKKIVNKVVVPLLGGKKSNAYKPLSKKVFSDLYGQVFREFGVDASSEIKRKDFEVAKEFVRNYTLPTALKNEIEMLNNQRQLNI